MRRVEVVPYDPHWLLMFEDEAMVLQSVLGDELIRLHHIGSTSVPGLAAKPIIDILAEVRNIETLDAFNPALITRGYTPKGEYGIPGRRYFYKAGQDVHYVHLHAFEQGHAEVTRHLRFRDYLRAHPEAAREYGKLKLGLAAQFSSDIDGYMDGKDALIKEIDRLAARWGGGKVTLDNHPMSSRALEPPEIQM